MRECCMGGWCGSANSSSDVTDISLVLGPWGVDEVADVSIAVCMNGCFSVCNNL